MSEKMVKEISKHPLLYIFVAILSTATATWMTSSFATMHYVDKEVSKVTGYVDKRHDEVKTEIKEIKDSVIKTESRVYKIWQHLRPSN